MTALPSAAAFLEEARLIEDGDGLHLRGRVPGPEHPVFEGHFPGQPLLPGWIQLALVQGLQPGSRGAARVRFRGAVQPGDELDVRVASGRFVVSGPDGPVATGSVAAAPAGPELEELAAGTDPGQELPVTLPHAFRARLIERAWSAGPARARCVGRVAPEHPLASAGEVPSSVIVELGAQAAATTARDGDAPGRVVAIKAAHWEHERVAADEELTVEAALVEDAAPLRNYAFRVPGHGAGLVSVWIG